MSHTEGKLTTNGPEIFREDGTEVCFIEPVFPFEEISADARRLVACWNACDGLLQDTLDGGWTASGINTYARGLEIERDELVKALRKVVEWNKKYPSNRVFSHYEIVRITKEMDEINSDALAILARYPEGRS